MNLSVQELEAIRDAAIRSKVAKLHQEMGCNIKGCRVGSLYCTESDPFDGDARTVYKAHLTN